ncbi:MAG: hypothetical protein M3Q23_17570 [Actinomycetota bacterium]|nr:hypothetical protein [Actinomycetota bacterium]
MLLADWAAEINGKLYIQGGGWSRIFLAEPASVSLAVKILVPWDQANRPHKIEALLLDDDGKQVMIDQEENGEVVTRALKLEGGLEVGRPPGMTPGTPIDAPLVLNFKNMDIPAGRYAWVFKIDDEEEGRVSFEVVIPETAPQALPGGETP